MPLAQTTTKSRFTFGGKDFWYEHNDYNSTSQNERTVEVPLGRAFLRHYDHVVEVGAVMPYYGAIDHVTIDLFDSWIGCVRADAETKNYHGQNVLSISTVEHLGAPEWSYGEIVRDDSKPVRFLDKLINSADHYLVTWALGQHKQLDIWAMRICKLYYLKRVNQANEWREVGHLAIEHWAAQYGRPYPFGNVVAVLTDNLDWLK
jgi:hypothetical protein